MKININDINKLLTQYSPTIGARLPGFAAAEKSFRSFLNDLKNHATFENYLNDQKLFEFVGQLQSVFDNLKQPKGKLNNFGLLVRALAEMIGYDLLAAVRILKTHGAFNAINFQQAIDNVELMRHAYQTLRSDLSSQFSVVNQAYSYQMSVIKTKINEEKKPLNELCSNRTKLHEHLVHLDYLAKNSTKIIGTKQVWQESGGDMGYYYKGSENDGQYVTEYIYAHDLDACQNALNESKPLRQQINSLDAEIAAMSLKISPRVTALTQHHDLLVAQQKTICELEHKNSISHLPSSCSQSMEFSQLLTTLDRVTQERINGLKAVTEAKGDVLETTSLYKAVTNAIVSLETQHKKFSESVQLCSNTLSPAKELDAEFPKRSRAFNSTAMSLALAREPRAISAQPLEAQVLTVEESKERKTVTLEVMIKSGFADLSGLAAPTSSRSTPELAREIRFSPVI